MAADRVGNGIGRKEGKNLNSDVNKFFSQVVFADAKLKELLSVARIVFGKILVYRSCSWKHIGT